MPWEPAPASPTPKLGARRRRRLLGITAAVVVVALIGGGAAYFELRSPNYADGKSAELAAEQHDDALLTGPVSTLPTTCTAKMNAAEPSQRPAKTDKVSVQQWLQGCEAAYHQQHPNQLVEDGIMWPSGTKPCSESCSSQWSATGKSIALAANEEPLINSKSAAADWCADLASNRFIQPLPVSVESQLHTHAPAARPETYSWNQGCAAQYKTMQANGGPAQPAAPVTVTGTFGTSPHLTIPEIAPPSSLYIKTLYQGTGAKVTSSEGMVGDYISYDWSGTTNKLLASSLTFNLLPGQGRFRGAWHVGFAWEKVTWCEALAAAFGPAWPGAGGFRDTGRGAEGAADVPEPPADAARGQRPGRGRGASPRGGAGRWRGGGRAGAGRGRR